MRRTMFATLMVIRVTGALLLLLGLIFWFGFARNLIPLHMLLGVLFVLAMLLLAGLSGRAGAPFSLVTLGFVWGLALPVLGMTQMGFLPGPWHWTIQLLHLVMGMAAMAIAHWLAFSTGIVTRPGRPRPPKLGGPAKMGWLRPRGPRAAA